MAVSFAVPTVFSLMDKMTPSVKRIAGGVDKFAVGAKAAFRSVIPHIDAVDSAIKKIALGNLLAKGITMAAGKAVEVIKSIPEAAERWDEIGKSAQKLGLATDTLQRYRYAANLAGVSNETLATAFQTMTRQVGSGALYASLEKIDMGLAAEVKQAKTVDEAFQKVAGAAARMTDAGARTAFLTSVFGKSGNQLVPMLGDMPAKMQEAAVYGNIVDPKAIQLASEFTDTVFRLKSMSEGFADVIRGAVVENLLPLIVRLQDWAAENREIIGTKISEWVAGVIGGIKFLYGVVSNAIQIIDRFKVVIIGVVVAFKTWEIVSGVTLAVKAFTLAQGTAGVATGGFTAILGGAKAAMLGFNAAIAANPIGFIITAVVTGITLAIIGIKSLSDKVGGLGNAFKVIAQSIMKWVLTPLNLAMDVLGGVLGMVGKIPGMKWAADAANGLQSTQDKLNTALTGSTSTLLSDGPGFLADPYRNARAAELARQEDAAEAKRKAEEERKNAEDEALIRKMDEMIAAQNGTTGAVENLNTASSAKGLKYSQMGADDIWAVARAGL